MLDKNKENIKIVFKNMPLNFHKMAEPAHRAARAADMQGKFWEYQDRIFAAGPEALNPQLLENTAKAIGLDMARFNKDRNSDLVLQRIRKDLIDAQRAGVTGTPTVFVNGRKVTQRTLEGFQSLIDEELAKAGK